MDIPEIGINIERLPPKIYFLEVTSNNVQTILDHSKDNILSSGKFFASHCLSYLEDFSTKYQHITSLILIGLSKYITIIPMIT